VSIVRIKPPIDIPHPMYEMIDNASDVDVFCDTSRRTAKLVM